MADRVVSEVAEEPEISRSVGPRSGFESGLGNSVWSCDAERSVVSALAADSGASDPRPLAAAELPHIVHRQKSSIVVFPASAEEPEIAGGISPCRGVLSATGRVPGVCGSERSVSSHLVRGP